MDTAITIDLAKPKGTLANVIRLTAAHLRGYLAKHPDIVEGGGTGRNKKWFKRRVATGARSARRWLVEAAM